jgi:hypothetical protein
VLSLAIANRRLLYQRRMKQTAIGAALVLAATSSLVVACVPGPEYGVRRDVYVGNVRVEHRDAPAEHHDHDGHHDDQHGDHP